MLALTIATVLSSAFGLIVRDSQLRHRNLWAVGVTNYLVAATFHLARWVAAPASDIHLTTLALGVLGGIAYSGSYLLFFPYIEARGVSVATAMLRLSVVVPVGLSILLWGERPDWLQAVGAGVALMALPLLAYRPPANPGQARSTMSRREWALLVALFVGNGLCGATVRAFDETGLPGESALFLGTLFGTAALVTLTSWYRHRAGTTVADLPPGIALGACNALSNLGLVMALAQLPGVLVFPFQSAVGLVMVAVFASTVWRERILRSEAWGMALAVAAVVLINLG